MLYVTVTLTDFIHRMLKLFNSVELEQLIQNNLPDISRLLDVSLPPPCPSSLFRFQLKCDDLQEKIRALSSLCRALDEDKKDIAEYLKHCVAAEQRKVEELAERLESRAPEAERDREALTLQLRQQLQQLQDGADERASVSRMQGESGPAWTGHSPVSAGVNVPDGLC